MTNQRLTILAGCGETTEKNNTYFISQEADTSPCSLRVCPMSADICQIRSGHIIIIGINMTVTHCRLNFASFTIHQPSTTYPGDGDPNSRGTCTQVSDLQEPRRGNIVRVCFTLRSPLSIFQARFMAQNDGPTPPVICGKNSGHHMILDTR